jgi:hypothetical protein
MRQSDANSDKSEHTQSVVDGSRPKLAWSDERAVTEGPDCEPVPGRHPRRGNMNGLLTADYYG